MRTTAASHRWGRDERGRARATGKYRERKERVGEMERNGKRKEEKKRRENKELLGEKGKAVGDLVEGESNQARIMDK